jgi:hypothetical protein
MPDDVFGDTKTPIIADPLANLVGEGKKFKTVEDLAKGKVEADSFIVKLQEELSGLRAQINPQFDAEAQLAELRKEIETLRNNPPAKSPAGVTPPTLTEDRIAALVNETITRAEANRSIQQNINAANDAMVAHFGTLEAAGAAVQAKAVELNMSVKDLKDVAAKSPTAFQKIVLGDAAKASEAPLVPRSANPTPPGTPPAGVAKPGTKEYFDGIFKESRKKYWSPEVQMELHKAVKAGTYQL